MAERLQRLSYDHSATKIETRGAIFQLRLGPDEYVVLGRAVPEGLVTARHAHARTAQLLIRTA